MLKSSKQIKHSLPKAVKGYSLPLSDEEYEQLNRLMIGYGRCRSMFFNELCGIHSMLNAKQFRKIRNRIKKRGLDYIYVNRYQFLNKHWIYALFETCSNVNAMWSNLANQIKSTAKDNDNLTNDERHYLYFVLRFPVLWHGILCYRKHAEFDLKKKYQASYQKVIDKVDSRRFHYLNNYLRRLTRRYKPKPRHHAKLNQSMTYDENMYRFGKNKQFSFSSAVNHKRFTVKLTSSWHYKATGNLQIILDRNKRRIEIHKLIQTHIRQVLLTKPQGIDKGLATLISCSNGHEYGQGFSKFNTDYAELLTAKNSHRNQIRSKKGSINNKGYELFCNRHKAYLQSIVNQALYQWLKQEAPSLVVKEDLSFTDEPLPKDKTKHIAKVHRKLNQWVKGYLNQRIEYLCAKYGIPTIDINPAYTSQYCPACGHHLSKRYGLHNQYTDCLNSKCQAFGKLNANIAAAQNILLRKDDSEINLYTPYKQVKKILDARIK